jgi:hypothetical protein
MLQQPTALFLINLIQDVSILRPLMVMARRDFGFAVRMLVSSKFRSRDQSGTWEAELEILRRELDAEVFFYRTDWDAVRHLDGSGIIFSASESSVPEHSAAHAVFRYAPPAFLKVTVQHGFECVGFRHNAAHDQAYGSGVSFGADIVCSWQPPQLEPALAASQRAKVEVTGPTAALQTFGRSTAGQRAREGMVCENLHSVRLKSTANLGEKFLWTFTDFCRLIGEDGGEVVLRPHPGGQYVLKNNVELPPNAKINNAPMFRLDLRRFAFGISAPSSVLIDFLCADVPTAIWSDAEGAIDTRNYDGITKVSGAAEWLEFAREAAANPAPFVKLQRRFLADQMMPIEPAEVFSRYASIFQAADRLSVTSGKVSLARQRLLIVANAHLPTVQVCLEAPLERLVRSGEVATELLTEGRLKQVRDSLGADQVPGWIERALDLFGPDTIIFSRYSGPYLAVILDWARSRSVPIIYHIDDDLLAVPRSLGERKHLYHNDPERLSTVRAGLLSADVVYASTERLRTRLLGYFPQLPAVAGRINASGRVRRTAQGGPARTLGYVASADHSANLEMVMGPITDLLDRHPELAFELFGSIPVPDELARFGDRIRHVAPIANYQEFLQALCSREWDIGICPLTSTDFNRAKSNNKWVEYTSAGIAVIASADTVYDQCCSDGCGYLCGSLGEWRLALERLVTDASERVAMVGRAQKRLETDYGIDAHREQILDVLRLAKERTVEEPIKEHA